MVGVGGRSRGCETCRRARVKCDEGRPQCARCVRLHLKCKGFSPFPVFIDGLSLARIQPEGNENHIATSISIPRGPDQDKDNILITHLVHALFVVYQNEHETTSPVVARWIRATTQTTLENRSTELALRAVASVYYGKLHCDRFSADRGAMLYTRALSETRRDLCDPVRVLDTTTLAGTLLLALYEMVTFKDTFGWLTHFLGIGQIVKLRGPHRHQTEVDKDLFLTTRYLVILACLVKNQRCFLEEVSWKEVPWKNDPASKRTIDHLLDVFCDVPGLLEDFNQLKEPSFADNRTTSSTVLTLKVRTLIQMLYNWREDWERRFPDAYSSVSIARLRDLGLVHLDLYPFPTAVFFSEPVRATEICLYNSILVLLHRLWKKLPSSVKIDDPFGKGSAAVNSTTLLYPGQGSIEDITGEICRTVYYHLLHYPGHAGSMQLMFPLQVAYRNVHPDSQEAQWLSGIIAHIADVNGFEAVKYSSTETTIVI